MNTLTIVLPLFLFISGCKQATHTSSINDDVKKDSVIGKIEWYEKSAAKLIDSNAIIDVIGKGFSWAEGPLWISGENRLLFSDVPTNKIFQWKNGDIPHVYLTPAGYTGKNKRTGEIGSNGLALDNNGKLLICQSGNREVVRLNTTIDSPAPRFTTLASAYNGKKLNSPNDLVVDKKNNIYFTDPIYGLPKGEKDPDRELPFEGVYKISAAGKLSLLIDSIPRPNGIAFSADEKTLYVASSDDYKPAWYAYALDEKGNIKSGHVLLNAFPRTEKAAVKQKPDGFKIDKYGNIFSAGPDGINIISPGGKLLGLIRVYNRRTSNCSFSATKDTLYVTASDLVLRVILHR